MTYYRIQQRFRQLAENSTRHLATASIVALLLVPFFATPAGAAAPGGINAIASTAGTYCATVLAGGTADKVAGRASAVLRRGCFATAQDKDAAVTSWKGASPTSLYLLMKLYCDADRGGGSEEFYSNVGCGGYYSYDDLGTLGWDNIASSAEPYCGRTFYLYENTYQNRFAQGAVRYMDAYINYLGALNDAVSSWDTAN